MLLRQLLLAPVFPITCVATMGVTAPPRDDDTTRSLSNAKYVELVSLREAADSRHVAPIAGPDGKTWYREPEAGADLRHLRLEDTSILPWHGTDPKQFAVTLQVKASYQNALAEWTTRRIGDPVGVVLGGRLRGVNPLEVRLRETFIIPPFDSFEEAQRVCAAVMAGGDVERATADLAAQRNECERICTAVCAGGEGYEEALAELRAEAEADLDELRAEYERAQAEITDVDTRHAGPDVPPIEFEIVSLSRTRDARHTQRVEAPDGDSWYCDPVPGLNSSHCIMKAIHASRTGADGFRAVLKADHVQRFAQWCRERRDRHFGIVLEKSLVHVGRMSGILVDELNRLKIVPDSSPPNLPETSVGTDTAAPVESPHIEFRVEEEPYLGDVLVVSPDYLQVVSLRRAKDATHREAIVGPAGETWYREQTPGIGILHLMFHDAFVELTEPSGSPTIRIPIAEEHRDRVRSWTAQRIGQPVGVILDGKLIWAGARTAPLTGSVTIPEFASLEDALRQCAAIRVAGDEQAAKEEFERMLGKP